MRTALTITASAAAILAAAPAFAAPAPEAPQPQEAAQAPVPTGPAATSPEVDTAQQGVLVFEPAFFAEQRPNTALDMVERVPGFSVNNGEGGRGFEGAVGNTLINGARPASKNDAGSSALFRIPAAQVERIELIRGGAPGIDMQGYAVVVNVIVKSVDSTEQSLQADGVFFDGRRTDIYGGRYQYTRRSGERTWSVVLADGMGIDDAGGSGISFRRDAAGVISDEFDYFNEGYGGGTAARVNYAGPLFGGKIDATARIGVSDFNVNTLFERTDETRTALYGEEEDEFEFGATYTRPLGTGLTSETRLIHEAEDGEEVSTFAVVEDGAAAPVSRFTSDSTSSESILRSLVRWQRSDSLSFEGGGEVAYNRLEAAQELSVGDEVIPLPSDQITVAETRGELFGKAVWRVSPRLSVETGLRLEASTISQSGDSDTEKTFTFVKPRAQVTWTPWADHQFRARVEREVGQLDFGDFAASASLDDDNVLGGNTDLEPEERWVAEIGYERRFWGEGVFGITYRHDEIRNAIDVIPLDDGLSAVGNIGDGTLDKLSVNLTLPTDKLGVSGGRIGFRNDWNHTEVTDPTTGRTRAVSGLRPSQPVISFSQDIPSWKFNYSLAWLPRLRQYTYDPDQTIGFQGTDYFELAAEYKPTPTLSIKAQLNIWDDFRVYRTVYLDRSPTRPIDFVEERQVDPENFLTLTVRKTF